jgi:acetolactate synthase-1/2/3 large subunit
MYGQMTITIDTADTHTLGELLAERLVALGVKHAFGFPGGGSNLDLFECLEDAGIVWTLAHTENAAAFMACACAEAERTLGVVVVGNGPGLASVVDGAAHAWLDRVPLLIVSDRYTEAEASTTGHQVIDQEAILRPVVKAGMTLTTSADVVREVDDLLATATAFPQGPVHLDVPRTAAAEPAPIDARASSSTPAPRTATPVTSDSGDRSAALGDIADRLAGAARPLILVGLEANAGVAPGDLRDLASACGAGAFTTYKAKGAYPETDGRWAGILTGGAIEAPLLRRADLMLAVGVDPVELLAKPWQYPAPVICLEERPDGNDYLRPAARLAGGIAEAVHVLARLLKDEPREGFSVEEIGDFREGALAALRLDPEQPLPGWRIVEAVDEVLGRDAIISVDAGAHMFPATNFARPDGPRRFLISNGLATMGFAVPAALGAALSRPDLISVAITGDGGMAYNAVELETAVRDGVRIVVVVINDSSLSLIRIKQEAKGYRRRPLDFGPVDYAALARSTGATGVAVDEVNALRAALLQAREAPGPTVIDVHTTGDECADTLAVVRG